MYSSRGRKVICSIDSPCHPWNVHDKSQEIWKISFIFLKSIEIFHRNCYKWTKYFFILVLLFKGARNTEKIKRTDLLRCPDFNLILNLVHILLKFKVIDLWIWELFWEPVVPLGFRKNKGLDHNTHRPRQMAPFSQPPQLRLRILCILYQKNLKVASVTPQTRELYLVIRCP